MSETLAGELRQPIPTIRRHLQVLVDAGLAEERADNPGTFGARLDRVGELGAPWPRSMRRQAGARQAPTASGSTTASRSPTRSPGSR